MTELSNRFSSYQKRVIFPKGKQKYFLAGIQSKLELSTKELAKISGICIRSMTDWKREKFSMSLPALEKLCQTAQISLPKDIRVEDPLWYVYKGGKIGGPVVYKKYGIIGGNPEYRKNKWYEWWEKEGKFKKHPIINVCIPICFPRKSSALAEMIGIILGDGSVSSRQVTITLHRFDDKYFIKYVRRLFKELFEIDAAIYKREREKTVSIVASRSQLVKFLVDMGLKVGGKVRQQVEVPHWIGESQRFTKACLRGLFDTDGCFYVDKHKYKTKIYLNAGMNFTNRSLPILHFFKDSLGRLGFHPTQKTKFSIFLRKEKEIVEYFNKIGSSNPKHLNKFRYYLKIIQGGVG